MNLNNQLKEVLEQALKNRQPAIIEIIMGAKQRLEQQKPEANAKEVGDSVENFTLPNAHGELISLTDLLVKGKVVLNFYRGSWCPFCNLELKALQERLPEIETLGASLVAVSMQVPDESLSTVEKNELSFEVLSDVNGRLSHELGIVFGLDSALLPVYEQSGFDLSKYNGNDSGELPMPATFIIDQNRTITHAFVDADYTKRTEPTEIINALMS